MVAGPLSATGGTESSAGTRLGRASLWWRAFWLVQKEPRTFNCTVSPAAPERRPLPLAAPHLWPQNGPRHKGCKERESRIYHVKSGDLTEGGERPEARPRGGRVTSLSPLLCPPAPWPTPCCSPNLRTGRDCQALGKILAGLLFDLWGRVFCPDLEVETMSSSILVADHRLPSLSCPHRPGTAVLVSYPGRPFGASLRGQGPSLSAFCLPRVRPGCACWPPPPACSPCLCGHCRLDTGADSTQGHRAPTKPATGGRERPREQSETQESLRFTQHCLGRPRCTSLRTQNRVQSLPLLSKGCPCHHHRPPSCTP